jgi:two-component system cell cycle sensor histidine kinase/response regulator CckA
MKRFLSWSIRTHLVIFISLLALPSLGLIVYSGLAARKAAIDEANKQCLEVVNSLVSEQQAIVVGAEQLAATLALLPEVRSHNSTATNALLRELVKKNARYANIVVGDASGSAWASAVPFQGQLSMADRKYFQDAVRTGMFSSGEYAVGKAAQKPTLGFGYPVKNASNQVIAVIAVALDLDYAQANFEKMTLPHGSSFGILDHAGIILIRNRRDPFSERVIGKRDPRQENFTPMTGVAPGGTFEAMGNDGIFRLAAYRKLSLPHESTPYLYVRSSIPRASATSAATAAMLKNLTAVGVLYLIGLLLVWLIGKRVIVNPITRLVKASEQLAAGAPTVRISRVVEGGDLGRLARSFDDMAEALLQKEKARDVAEASLRESEERYRTTVASIGDAVIVTDTEGLITFLNPEAERLTSWPQKDALGQPLAAVFRIINEQTRQPVENPVDKVLRMGTVVGLANHTVLITKDGRELPIDDSGAPVRQANGSVSGVVLVFRDFTERRKAEERTKHLASFPELNPNPILEISSTGEITFCNSATERILENFGLDKGACSVFLPPDLDALLTALAEGKEASLYREVAVKDRVFGQNVHLAPAFSVVRIYAYDITERKRTEEALVRAKETWERTFASVPDLIAILDDQHRIVRVNEAMAARLGLKAEECIGVHCYEAVHGLSGPPDYCPHSRTIKDGRQHVAEVHEDRLGGDFVVSTTPLYDDQGKMIGTVHVAHDITKRKQAEEALRENQKQMSRAQELAHLGSWELDVVNNRLSWSDEVYRIFGLKPQEFTATYDAFLEAVHPDDRAAVDAVYSGSLREESDTYEIEHRVVRKSTGEVRIVHEKCEHVKDGSGRIIRSVGMVHDITERKRAEAALKKAREQLERRVEERTNDLRQAYDRLIEETKERERLEEQLRQAQKMEAIGTLAGGIAHDFNNILAAMIGFSELAMDDIPADAKAQRYLKRIFEAGIRGRELVRQILAFSRKTEGERKEISLTPLVKETHALLRSSLPTTIEMSLVITTSDDCVLAYPAQIQQVLMNLATNAAYAMRENGGQLTIELSSATLPQGGLPEPDMQPGTYVKLTVKDTGTGMAEDVRQRIFEPFFTTKEQGKGTGMGLAVVYGVVKSHGGGITLQSKVGAGSTFEVFLPRAPQPEAKKEETTTSVLPEGTERILFVDDEEMLVEMARGMLEGLGYRVTAAKNPTEAWNLFVEDPFRFDLVITDQTMPDVTGITLAEKMLGVRKEMPIILCTGYSEMVSAEKAKEVGICAFVMKPVVKKELAETIRGALDRRTD